MQLSGLSQLCVYCITLYSYKLVENNSQVWQMRNTNGICKSDNQAWIS